MSNVVEVTLPRGRIVYGHPMKMVPTTDPQTKTQKINQKTGQPMIECFIQIAINKQDPGLGPVFTAMQTAANRQMQAAPNLDQFAWKVDDGDSMRMDSKTNQQVARPDHARGCWLFNIKAHGWAPKCVYHDGSGYSEIMDPAAIKCGDYVQVGLRMEPNGASGYQAGIYMNPSLVLFLEPGEAISTGAGATVADAANIFGGAPQGASMPPAGGFEQPAQQQFGAPGMQPTGQPPMGNQGMPGAGPVNGMPPQGAVPGTMPQGTVLPGNQPPQGQPAHDFVNNAGQPQGVPAGQPAPGGWTPPQ